MLQARWPATAPDMGCMVSAFGAVVLIVSVFLPWYERHGARDARRASGAAAATSRAARARNRATGALARGQTSCCSCSPRSRSSTRCVPLARGDGQVPGGAGGAVVLLGALAAALRALPHARAARTVAGGHGAVAARGRMARAARLARDRSRGDVAAEHRHHGAGFGAAPRARRALRPARLSAVARASKAGARAIR